MKIGSDTLRAMLPLEKSTTTPRWLALRFPHLALDLYGRGQARQGAALAVSGVLQRRECILDANPAALAAGVQPGMPVSAARGILDSLQLCERQPEQERQALQRLARWCYQYSHQVSIPGDRAGLFVEIGASERLFGPPQRIAPRLVRELGRLGYHALAGSAPTPEAAWLSAPSSGHIRAPGHIREQLAGLPLSKLHLDSAQVISMERMGFRRLGDLLRLPRKALTRRFGPDLPDYIDRLLGVRDRPLRLYQPPETFSSRLELPAEIRAAQALLFPVRRLLEEFSGVLRGGDLAVQNLEILLLHEDAEDSRLALGLQSPTQDAERLQRVLRERLERLRLPAAVREVRLEAPRLLRFDAGQRSLFHDTPADRQQDVEQLAERLQARLGPAAVSGLTGVEDHRPEHSWRNRRLDEAPDCTALAHRPAWLLPRPQRCMIGNYEILAGPERIESGWWDGRDCRRDYFIVRDAQGSLLWAFHEHKPRRGWFLHGIFA